ncbi:MAG: hydroxymethylglutaryl-CoA lyase [Bernardetiaceae bacterium]|jgi:hydroxymethylglutaryl-CoA lyase|nr:hydroxymethylglutaryl-CoA lyase [Bernardetiaceae bacterium]
MSLTLVECPRDAMQGLEHWIATADKVRYLQTLLDVGFHTLDFGSFVSPEAIPQMRDTPQVLAQLDLSRTRTALLAIVAGSSGAKQAAQYPQIKYLGFPLSVSETFQLRNTNRTIAQAVDTVRRIRDLAQPAGQTLVVYLSMGFGNPYGDPYSPAQVVDLAGQMVALGLGTLMLADTVASARPADIGPLFGQLTAAFPQVAWGLHLHSPPRLAQAKMAAAWQAGCRRFDTALLGYGGCPLATDHLTGNLPTEVLLAYCQQQGVPTGLNEAALAQALALCPQVMGGG